MTPKELLNPRFKVIANYPMSKYSIGDIIQSEKDACIYGTDEEEKDMHNLKNYPAIFKLLQWWEDRKVEDTPEYLLYKNNGICFKPSFIELEFGKYYETDKQRLDNDGFNLSNTILPAIEQDYLTFKSKGLSL